MYLLGQGNRVGLMMEIRESHFSPLVKLPLFTQKPGTEFCVIRDNSKIVLHGQGAASASDDAPRLALRSRARAARTARTETAHAQPSASRAGSAGSRWVGTPHATHGPCSHAQTPRYSARVPRATKGRCLRAPLHEASAQRRRRRAHGVTASRPRVYRTVLFAVSRVSTTRSCGSQKTAEFGTAVTRTRL